MQRSASKRPSPSLVLSMVTLFVALTSTAGALPGRHLVDRGDLGKGAVTSRALARGAVKARAIAPRAVTGAKLANHAVVEGKLARFSVGAFALGNTATISVPIPDQDASHDLTWTASPTVEAVCTSGTTLLGGGVSITDGSAFHEAAVQTSAPSTDRWLGAIATNTGGAAPGRVYAICLL